MELHGKQFMSVSSFLFLGPLLIVLIIEGLKKKSCRIRVPFPFQWGAPTFDAGESFAMMMASFVALVEVCLHSFT